jgi:CDP-glucose 4,6-dehydratase
MAKWQGSLEGLEIMVKDIFSNAFKEKTVLVTGHTGFKGGWLALWLETLGAKVVGYSLDPPTDPSFFKAVDLENRIISAKGDIRDLKNLVSIMSKHKPEYIFHLAAQPLVRRSYRDPIETFEVNVMGTLKVLEAVRSTASVKVCVCITSDKCYENLEWVYAYRENDPMGGHDPYSASKGAAELAISSYRSSFLSTEVNRDISISSVRAGNVIGGGDWAEDRIIPDCIRALTTGRPMTVRNPIAIRPWQHVLDPLAGYLLLASRMRQEPDRFAGSWNFGPLSSNNIPVYILVEKFIAEWGNGSWENVSSQSRCEPHEANFLRLDISKANGLLGWMPAYSITDDIKETAAWYRAYYNNEADMYDFTVSQIRSYTAKFNNGLKGWLGFGAYQE